MQEQTAIVARDQLDIRTGAHTQLDGAVIASQTGRLKLDTDTLGFRDIEGEDREHSYYINAGGSYGWGSGSDDSSQPATGKDVALQDQSQQGKGKVGQSGWSVSGYDYRKEREQIVRATVGEGEIVVRSDAQTSNDSTAGLNRDIDKAYEITRDDEERTELYVSKSSVEAVRNPVATFEAWSEDLIGYMENVERNGKNAKALLDDAAFAYVVLSQYPEHADALVQIKREVKSVAAVTDMLDSRKPSERLYATAFFTDVFLGHFASTPEGQALSQKLLSLAEEDRTSAARALALISGLVDPRQNGSQPQNYQAAVGVAGLVLLAAYLASSGSALSNGQNPDGPLAGGESHAWTSQEAQLGQLLGIPGFEAHSFDNTPLITPIHLPPRVSGSEGGYGVGGRAGGASNTGGNQLDGVEGSGSYTTPEHQLNPGNMYSESDIKNVYDSIRQAPKFPTGFKDAVGGTTKNSVKDNDVLAALRKVESGTWQKIYKDGYDATGVRVSIHYFQSKSGKVFDVKVKDGWSNR